MNDLSQMLAAVIQERGFQGVERVIDPQEIHYYCPECEDEAYRIYRENMYGDVVGCNCCAEFKSTFELRKAPLLCPNCGEPTYGNEILVTNSGVALACSTCCEGEAL